MTRPQLWLFMQLPALPLEVRLRGARATREAVVIRSGKGRTQHVLLGNVIASDCGIQPGMPLGAAHALASLRVLERDADAEQRALTVLASWGMQFTSWVTLVDTEGLLLEVGGSLGLFGGMQSLVERIRAGIGELGYAARISVAPTPLAAIYLCRAGQQRIVRTPEELDPALGTLPLEVLCLSASQQQSLKEMGLATLRDCRRLPHDGLARRIGRQMILCLERAWGGLPDPRPRFTPPAYFSSVIELAQEVDHSEALVFAARRLLQELTGFLRARCAGVQQMRWCLSHGPRASTTIPLGVRIPTRDAGHWLLLLRERLARMELSAPVRAISLEASEILVLAERGRALPGTGTDKSTEALETLYDRLAARLGQDAVHGLATCSDYRPERAWQPCQPGHQNTTEHIQGQPPLWLLLTPRALHRIGERPALNGPLYLKRECERVETGWWDGHGCRRDYYLACNPRGEWFWVFRDLHEPRQWYLHGIFE